MSAVSDIDLELPILDLALQSPAFYIGALGSGRTHEKRVAALEKHGFASRQIDRIKAPIGLFKSRDATSLALSVLGEIANEFSGYRRRDTVSQVVGRLRRTVGRVLVSVRINYL